MRFVVLLAAVGCASPAVQLDRPPSTSCDEVACVEAPEGVEHVGYHRLRVDEAGVAWVSWVEATGASERALWIARSPAPGAPLEGHALVPTPEPPLVGGSEKPALAVAGGRVALAYTSVGLLRHGDARGAWVQLGAVDRDGQVVFDDAVQIDASDGDFVLEQAHVALGPDGEGWVLYKRQEYGVRDLAMWARESTGYVPEPVSDELSTAHECSPPELQVTRHGDPVAVLRSHIAGRLQTVVVTPEGPAQVTDSRWEYAGAVCPEDGPRLALLSDGSWVVVWIEPTSDGSTWRSWTSTSADGGTTWSTPVPAHPDDISLGEREPSIAPAHGGYLVGVEALDRTTRVWDQDGRRVADLALEEVELATGGGRTAALGLDATGVLRLVEVP